MIIYNITVKIDHDVHDEWLKWMKEVHIPEVMATKKFTANNMYRILFDVDGGVSYSIQYSCKDIETLQNYQIEYAPALQKAHLEKLQK